MIFAQEEPPQNWFPMPVFIAIVVAIFYFLILRPQSRKERERKQMVENLKKGSRIVTIGGILGTVAAVKEDEIVLRVDEERGTCLRMVRSAVNRVLSDEEEAGGKPKGARADGEDKAE